MSSNTERMNASLSQYSESDTKESQPADRPPGCPLPKKGEISVNLTKPPVRDNSSISSWEKNRTEQGLQVKSFKGSGYVGGDKELQVAPHDGRWVIGGPVKDYLHTHGDRVWPIPDTYKAFDEFPRYLAEMDGAHHRYGKGISAEQLEKTLRLLTGGGHYTASDYTLFACGTKPYVLTGPEGTLLSKVGTIHPPDNDWNRPEVEVNVSGETVEVEEGNENIITGISRLGEVLQDHFNKRLNTHTNAPGSTRNNHWFKTCNGKTIAVDASDLETLGKLATTPESVAVYEGGEVSLPLKDYTAKLTWSDPSYKVGDSNRGSPIVGYDFVWKRQPGLKYSGRIHTYWLYETQRSGYFQYQLNHYTTRLGNVEL